MDTTEFERLLGEYVVLANTGDPREAELAAWEALREAAGLLSVPMPLFGAVR